jgi:hypothetical protein
MEDNQNLIQGCAFHGGALLNREGESAIVKPVLQCIRTDEKPNQAEKTTTKGSSSEKIAFFVAKSYAKTYGSAQE